jgi:hypothetical protein
VTRIPHQWLRQIGTPEEFEQARLINTAHVFNLTLEKVIQKFGQRPFGKMTNTWKQFIQQFGDGDELWFFSSPDNSFAKGLGCQGYAIVRGGVIFDTFVTLRT